MGRVRRVANGTTGVTDFSDNESNPPLRRRTGLDAVSAVKMSEDLTAAVDAWAEAHRLARSDAIRKLVEIGLKTTPVPHTVQHPIVVDPNQIEELAVQQIDQMLDPALPADERERRIRRLTEGPPEFSRERIDLPKHRD